MTRDAAEAVPARPDAPLGLLATGAGRRSATVAALVAVVVLLTGGLARFMPEPQDGRALVAVVLTVMVAHLTGHVARLAGQPRVIGEIVGGILLGPSVFGLAWPDGQTWLFSTETMSRLQRVADLGLVFFMFLVGLRIERTVLRGRRFAVMSVCHASVVLPFGAGLAVAVVLPPMLTPAGSAQTFFVFFLGIAFGVTAFPVLARILVDRGIIGTHIGSLALACAAVIDLAAWFGVSLLTGLVQARGAGPVLLALCGAAGLTALLMFVVRPLLQNAADRRGNGRLLTAVALVGVPCAALAAEHVGLHLVVGAFLLGMVFPRHAPATARLRGELGGALTTVLLPPFFALVGLRTDLGDLSAHPALWAWAGLLLLVAMLSKIVGSAAGARLGGLGWHDSATLGVLLSCRGLTELVVLDIGRSLGLLTPTLFTMLVLVAILSTVLTGPLLDLIDTGARHVHMRQTRETS